MHEPRTISEWVTPGWKELAVAWVDERLGEAGASRTGEAAQPRIRAWATVLRIPTTAGTMWLKAASRSTDFEVRLYPLLARVAPEHVLHPIAVEPTRGWVLLPDAGDSLASLEPTEYLGILERVLPQYGELQVTLMPHVVDMLGLGVADMRAECALERFDEAAVAVRDAAVGEHVEVLERTLRFRETFGKWAHELANSPVPASLDHNDLHAGNILIPPAAVESRTRFYDWGDSVVAHPFSSMLLGLGWVRALLETGDHDPRLSRLRDAYLEPFSHLGSHSELVESLELACRVGKAARSLIWARAAAMDDVSGFELAPLLSFTGISDSSYLSAF
jgi:hypothetical protein